MTTTFKAVLADEQASRRVAQVLAAHLRPGDSVLLDGPVGAGKSFIARAALQSMMAAAGQPVEDVPSPSFTLVQTYDIGGQEVIHADLYRLSMPDELTELGLEEAFAQSIVFLEWPARLGPLTPARHILLRLDAHPGDPGARSLELTAAGPGWAPLLTAVQEALA